MNPHSADSVGAVRVAVVGASTSDGARIREALARRGVPGSRVDLYGATQGEAILSEYNGEARLIQEPALDEISRHEVVFLCEGGEVPLCAPGVSSGDPLVIDLVRATEAGRAAPPVHADINPEVAREGGTLRVPHSLALVLAELLHPLERGPGLEQVVAVALRPAADFGDEGVEELREQTVRLLNFQELPTATFGSQLAFNILSQGQISETLETEVGADVSLLLGWPHPRLSLRMLVAPLFHGHMLLVNLRTKSEASPETIREALSRCPAFETDHGPPYPSPLEVSTSGRNRLGDVAADGRGGFWLSAVLADAAAWNAVHAVRLADDLIGL